MHNYLGPCWTTSNYTRISGEDHLGIRYVSILIADRLQTGITTITPRARYWSFFVWVLHDFIQTQQDLSIEAFKKYLKRQEWYYILANIAEGKERDAYTRQLMGVTRGMEAWDSDVQALPNRDDYLKNTFGGYNIYRNVMKILGLTREGDLEKGVELDRITPLGRELADAFEQEIKDTEYYKEWRHWEEPVPREVLLEYGRVAGLSRLTENSRDLPLLKKMFLPEDAREEHHNLRFLSLYYYLFIINMKKSSLNRAEWRETMYDMLSPKAEEATPVPETFKSVAAGWEIYQGRQLFTYSLETIWSYFLVFLASRSYTVPDLIEKMVEGLDKEKAEVSVEKLLEAMPLRRNERDEYLDEMGRKGGAAREYIWQPLLVMLDVYLRFKERDDFLSLHNELMELGGIDHISLRRWEKDVKDFKRFSAREFLVYIISRYIIEQHQKVALNKILTTRNETYHFVENEGRLFYIASDSPAFNALRIEQAVSILVDLGFIRREGNQLLAVEGVGINEHN